MSNVDRKKWIAEDHYLRTHYGIKIYGTQEIKNLKEVDGRTFRFLNDPPNYNILSNAEYCHMFQFVSLPLATSRLTDGAAVDQEQIETSDLITRALYWQFRDRDAAN